MRRLEVARQPEQDRRWERLALRAQSRQAVRCFGTWALSVRKMMWLELNGPVGPGKVLSGLIKRIYAEARIMNAGDLQSIQTVKETT